MTADKPGRLAPCSRDFLVMTTTFAFATGITSVNNALLMRERGLSFTALGLIVGAFFLTAAALNIPTGILADLAGRKKLAVAGYLLYGVGLLVFGLAASPALFLVAHVIEGMGLSLWSGAFEAWYVDSLKAQDRYDECRRVFGINAGAGNGACIVAGFCAAPLIGAGMTVPFHVAGALSLAVALFGTLRMREPPRTSRRASFAATAGGAFALYAKSPALMAFTVGQAAVDLSTLLFAVIWQSHLVGLGVRAQHLGYIYSLFMAAAAVAGLGYAAAGPRVPTSRLVIGPCLAVAVLFGLLTGVPALWAVAAAMALYHLAVGVARPAATRWRNDLILDYRATMISILTSASFMLRAGFGALAGGIADLGGTAAGVAAVGVAGLVAAVAFAICAALERRPSAIRPAAGR